MARDDTPRWHYRFENYERALNLLKDAIAITSTRELTQLEREGVVQRFEYTWELAWKTLKDYLTYNGITPETITPRSVIREAFAAQIIDNGELWMKALDARNDMAHRYDEKLFARIILDIQNSYITLFESLYSFLKEKQ